MSYDELDHILSREEEILPSSGFATSVMEAVRREAATPPPIPFPWKRALPLLIGTGVALAVALVAGIVVVARWGGTATSMELSLPLMSVLRRTLEGGLIVAAGWVVLALLLTLASVTFSMRIASDRA